MARRRRKAATKKSEPTEPEEEVSSTGDEIDSSLQDDPEEATDMPVADDGDGKDSEEGDKQEEVSEKQVEEPPTEEPAGVEQNGEDIEKMETDEPQVLDSVVENPACDVAIEDNVSEKVESPQVDKDGGTANEPEEEPGNNDSAEIMGKELAQSPTEDEKQEKKPEADEEETMHTDEDASKDSPQEEYETVDATENTDGTDNVDQPDDEEGKAPPMPKVEKEPSKPECHDDDSCEVPIDPEAEEDEEVIGSESPEFLKFWRAVLDNPHDFTNWTYLLQLVEQENKPPLARRAYNGFFKRYPLCYGYWKKFSEMEKRNGNLVRAQRILERGVRAIPLSIDLWVHMIDFYINYYKGPDAGSDKVRKVFERAVEASGKEFRSEKLWNKYIRWEQSNKNWKEVVAVYDRVLKIPTQHYAIFFKDCKDFVNSRSPKEVLSLTDFEALLNEVRDEAEAAKKEEEEKPAPQSADDDDAPPGVESDDRGKPPNDKELKAVSGKIIAKRKKIFEETEALVTKIWTFEEGIKRPYFHVKALERTQIKNWRDYLEAEINRKEKRERIILLFERCLIACALYEDFWLKYARYLMRIDPPAARNVFQRACEIHLPKKPNIHMHWATFEEMEGNTKAASGILERLDKTLSNMAMIRLRRVAVERRAGNLQVAEDLLKTFVSSAPKGNECFYVRKFVWFLVKVSNKFEVARQVLKDAIERNQEQIQLYKDLIGLEFSHGDEEHVIEACDLAINCTALSEESRFKFSQRKLEYLEDYGVDAGRTQKAYDDHQKLFRSHKKRTQSQSESSAIQPITKKAKTDSSPASGSKIMSTNSTRHATKTATNGSYSYQATQSSTITAAPVQTSHPASQQQAYQQQTAAGDPSLYYQNYWNYQQKPADVQQYNYSTGTWQQYPQQQYYNQ